MTEEVLERRIDDLEFRSAHQEAALEDLTTTVMAQRQQLEELGAQLEYMKSLLQDLSPSAVAPASEETPPPHY